MIQAPPGSDTVIPWPIWPFPAIRPLGQALARLRGLVSLLRPIARTLPASYASLGL